MELWRHFGDEELGREARSFCLTDVMPVADEIDETDRYPRELTTATALRGWNTLTLPIEYGGQGASLVDQLVVFEELSVGSGALGISLITNFQCQKVVERFGSESLKARLLPKYSEGLCTSFSLTEPGRGSDIRTVDTVAHRTPSGWELSGEKAFITSGDAADVMIMLVQAPGGLALFEVATDLPGVTKVETRDAATFGLRNGPHVNLILDKVQLPEDALIGVEGKGLKQAMVTLSSSRILAAGISLGIARAAFDESLKWAHNRQLFDQTALDFQGIQWYFAEAATKIDAARALVYQAADDVEHGRDIERASSEAKLFASRVATEVADRAIQVCGAHGTRVSSPFGRYFRDAKAYELAGGSSEVLKNTIARSLRKAVSESEEQATQHRFETNNSGEDK